MPKQTILTGIRSNEEPTLANYLGAMLPMVEMQRKFAGQDYQLNMFVPDLHSFTTPIDHSKLYGNTIHNIKYFIAAGLTTDSKNTIIYRQSYVPAHSELTWILDCFTGVGEMQRMTQYKDKSQGSGSVSMGLMNYPVLMAADILLYNAKYVPVGADQTQHLEITRDIALRMNHKFGELFTVPEDTKNQLAFRVSNDTLRIRSLTDPTKKMSKSSTDEKSKINLSDDPSVARKKIMSATTDSIGCVNWDWDSQPGITSMLQMLSLLTEQPQQSIIDQWQGCERYGDFKKAVADAVENFLINFQKRYNSISDAEVIKVLEEGEEIATQTANQTLLRVQKAVGLRP